MSFYPHPINIVNIKIQIVNLFFETFGKSSNVTLKNTQQYVKMLH